MFTVPLNAIKAGVSSHTIEGIKSNYPSRQERNNTRANGERTKSRIARHRKHKLLQMLRRKSGYVCELISVL